MSGFPSGWGLSHCCLRGGKGLGGPEADTYNTSTEGAEEEGYEFSTSLGETQKSVGVDILLND